MVNKIISLGFVAASIAVMTFVLFSGVTESGQQVNMVVLEVFYSGSSNATITENGIVSVQPMFGLMRMTFMRGNKEEWVISASVEKLDSGTGILYVYFKMVDGEVLVSASTSEPYGVAKVSLTL